MLVKANQNEETTFKCKICCHILKSSETLKSHKKANYRCRSLVGKYKSQRSKASFDMWNRKSLYSIDKKKWKIRRYW